MLKRKPRKGEVLLYDGSRGRVQAEVLGFFAEDIISIRLPTGDTQIIWRFGDGLNKLLSHTVRCPLKPRVKGDATGCGAILLDAPDEEGLVRCTSCNMWFKPVGEVCEDHWHCDTKTAGHSCAASDRTSPCPTCGEAPYCQEHDLDLIEGRCPECAKVEDHEEARAIASQLTP
jgi:hypothetical protein